MLFEREIVEEGREYKRTLFLINLGAQGVRWRNTTPQFEGWLSENIFYVLDKKLKSKPLFRIFF